MNREFQRHLMKLDEIQNLSRLSLSREYTKPEEHKRTISSVQKPRGYVNINRDYWIKNNNRKLLDKLVEISTGKFVFCQHFSL